MVSLRAASRTSGASTHQLVRLRTVQAAVEPAGGLAIRQRYALRHNRSVQTVSLGE